MSKQDRQGVRTVTDLERKYIFGKRFAEVMGVATDAQSETKDLKDQLNETLTPEEIFNILTEDGKQQCIKRDENGEIYINASYIRTGVLEMTKSVFIEPGIKEILTIQNHILGKATLPDTLIPLYDFNSDGVVTLADLLLAQKAANGDISLEDTWSGAKKTKIYVKLDFFSDTETIKYSATDMWGNHIEYVVGFGSAFFKTERNGCAYREYDDEKEWLNPAMTEQISYRTAERFDEQIVYKKLVKLDISEGGTYTIPTMIDTSHTIVGVNCIFNDGVNAYSTASDMHVVCKRGTSAYYDVLVSTEAAGTFYAEIKYV